MNFRKSLMAATLGMASALPMAASAITIDGIEFDLGFTLEDIKLWEGRKCNPADIDFGSCTDGDAITGIGQELIGIGRVDSIFNASNEEVWSNGDNGMELTVYLYGYLVESVTPVPPFGEIISFSGGVVEIYSDNSPDFDATGSVSQGIASATDGNLWLSLVGSPIGGVGAATGAPITLNSPNISGAVLGTGLLDVTGGLAASYFDTDSFGCDDDTIEPCPDSADKKFTSSGALAGGGAWSFTGSGDVFDRAVPEPTSLALLGAGLVGAGLSARRRRKAA